MTEVVAQPCRTVYDTTIMIIHSANLNRASTSSYFVVDQHYADVSFFRQVISLSCLARL